ncbi:MAG: hypothetical protein K5681_06605 [Treponema sp.]|nr:hypothetical protein [Treponema sp.]
MINYRGTPLFGQDSSPQHTSEFLAIIGAILFWLIFTFVMIFAKPFEQKPKYKEVQIVLASTPVVKETEANPAPAAAAAASAPAPVAEAVPEPVPEPVAKETPPAPAPEPVTAAKAKAEPVVEKPKPAAKPKAVEKAAAKPKPAPTPKKETPKPAPVEKAAPAPVAAPEEPIEYALDPMEAFAQQTKKQPKQEFDWSMFEDEATEVESTSSQTNKVSNNTAAFEGSAGSAAASESKPLTSQSKATGASQNKAVSSQTSSALSGIKDSKYIGRAANGITSETSVKAKASGSGAVVMEMSNGSTRALLKPSTPAINLSEQAAATIDSSRTVTIRFRVLEAGNVPRAEITIEPESTLHQLVRDEIRDQVSAWLFEADDYSAYAGFTYKIVKQ